MKQTNSAGCHSGVWSRVHYVISTGGHLLILLLVRGVFDGKSANCAARGYDTAVWSLKPPEVAQAFVNFKDGGPHNTRMHSGSSRAREAVTRIKCEGILPLHTLPSPSHGFYEHVYIRNSASDSIKHALPS